MFLPVSPSRRLITKFLSSTHPGGTFLRNNRVSERCFSSQFYKVAGNVSEFQRNPESTCNHSVVGEIIDHVVDLKNARPGETIDLPYELTVASSMRDFWQSAFYSHDRINTSTPFARSLGFQSEVIPFGLMLFLASSMSHVDYAKLENGHSNAKYLWPVFAGDTLKKRFIILSLRPTSDGRHSIYRIHCEMKNQRGVVVFTCEKTMLFPFHVVRPSEIEVKEPSLTEKNDFLNHLIQKADVLQTLGSQTLTSLRPGQLIIHTLTRPLSETQCMQLSSLARLTHERHFNTRLFRRDEMFVPGGLVLGLTCSQASRDLHEVQQHLSSLLLFLSSPFFLFFSSSILLFITSFLHFFPYFFDIAPANFISFHSQMHMSVVIA
jgi:acyl dehydratase